MPATDAKTTMRTFRRRGRLTPFLCNLLGGLLLVAVIGVCLPTVVPRLMGYEVFDVPGGSMEPSITAGSAVYVRAANPLGFEEGDIIAFNDGNGEVVTHRVVENDTVAGELVTKGDDNLISDAEPVPYDNVVGTVVMHVPLVGPFASLTTDTVGRIYLIVAVVCSIMLNVLAERMRAARRAELVEAAANLSPEALAAVTERAMSTWGLRSSRGSFVRGVIMGVLAVVFVGSGAIIWFVNSQHQENDRIYAEAVRTYQREREQTEEVVPPIEIDFASLQATNPDVVGWLYCEGTVINYPVLHGDTNDQYLRRDYTGAYSMDGSLFVDCDNAKGFTDASTIIYGHNMGQYHTMFADLDAWADQAYYDQHPMMWLLTPEQNYQVLLVAGHHVNARSDYYDVICHEHNEVFTKLLEQAIQESDFTPVVEAMPESNYVMLSTCAYIFDNARYAMHGMLVPVGGA